MTGAGWGATNMTVAKSATGIDGSANSATTLTATDAAATVLHVLAAAASSRTYSAFIRRVTGTGTVKLVQNTTKTSDLSSSLNTLTYTRVSLNASVDVTTAGYGIELGTSGDVIEVDFNQFESGPFMTSPMASAGAVRNADVLSYPSSGNVLTETGTVYAELGTLWTTAAVASKAVTFDNTASAFQNAGDALSTSIRIFDGTTSDSKSGLTSMATGSRRRAASWGASGLIVTGDGATPATSAFDATIGNTNISIGCAANGIAQWNGLVKNVRIWQQQLTSAHLQAITN
jgi:hypothetical protein